ncbi:MAG: hypothetical protein ACJASQ_002039 [Crocinitomicaceae bacterium]|jgi:hypothetical protein
MYVKNWGNVRVNILLDWVMFGGNNEVLSRWFEDFDTGNIKNILTNKLSER